MKPLSVADVVFFMVAATVCYLAALGKPIDPLFLGIAGGVFGAFYNHKSNKTIENTEPNTSSTTTTTNTNTDTSISK